METLTYPGNKTVTYTYDALNRLETVTLGWLSGQPSATYVYDDAGRMTDFTNFNGITTAYGYDDANRLLTIDSPVASYGFTLDGNGNREGETSTEPLPPAYPTAVTSYGYNVKGNRLLTAGDAGFGYDSEGQLSGGYGSGYRFDSLHRLTAMSGASYAYDGSNNRLQATRGGVTTRYLYDAAGNLLAETDGSNNVTRYYIHGAGLLAMVTPDEDVYCYHYNATGSTVAVTDDAQVMVNKYSYDPFGNIGNQVEAVPQPFKYVGQFGVMAEPNGFYYMRARYYDPNVGRFISEDPLGFEGGDVNLSNYVGGNPVNFVDPSGLYNTAGDWFFQTVAVVGGAMMGAGAIVTAPAWVVPVGIGLSVAAGVATVYQYGPALVDTAKEYAGRVNDKVLEPSRQANNESMKNIDGMANMTTSEKAVSKYGLPSGNCNR